MSDIYASIEIRVVEDPFADGSSGIRKTLMGSHLATESLITFGPGPADQQLSMDEILKLMPRRKLTEEDFIKQTHLEYKKKAELEASLGPEAAPIVNRKDMLDMLDTLDASDQAAFDLDGNEPLVHVVIDKPQIFSTADLKSLSPLNVASMMLRKTHKGNYLLCRTISAPVYDLGIAFLLGVEDPEGTPAYVKLLNYALLLESVYEEVDSVMPLGTILAIREPTYSANPAAVGLPFVQVESPSDIVFIESEDAILREVSWKGDLEVSRRQKSGEEWHEEGQEHIDKENWLSAAISFTNCIKLEQWTAVSFLHRSLVYNKLDWQNSVLCDAQKAMDISSSLPEGFAFIPVYRKIRALYALQRYEEAMEACKLLPDDEFSIKWVQATKKRIEEQQTGVYDWLALLQKDKLCFRFLDAADFTGPVEIKKDLNGLRGLYATRNVKAGELLMLHKALARVSPSENPMKGFSDMLLEHVPSAKSTDDRDFYRLFCAAVKRAWDDEHAYKTMLSLYAGDHHHEPGPMPSPAMDSRPLEHPTKPKVDIDVDYLYGVVCNNSFGSGKADSGLTLFGLPSLLNHSCVANTNRTFYADVIVIRARRDIKEGEELTTEYIEGSLPHDEKRLRLMNTWRFSCSCDLCKADEDDGYAAREERRRLLKDTERIKNQLRKLNDCSPKFAANALYTLAAESKKICNRLRETYHEGHDEKAGGLRYELASALHGHAEILLKLAEATLPNVTSREMVALDIETLQLCGVKMTDDTVSSEVPEREGKMGALPISTSCISNEHQTCMSALLRISTTYLDVGIIEKSKRWFDAAVWMDEIRFGGGFEAFKIRQETELNKYIYRHHSLLAHFEKHF